MVPRFMVKDRGWAFARKRKACADEGTDLSLFL